MYKPDILTLTCGSGVEVDALSRYKKT